MLLDFEEKYKEAIYFMCLNKDSQNESCIDMLKASVFYEEGTLDVLKGMLLPLVKRAYYFYKEKPENKQFIEKFLGGKTFL